MVGQPWLHGAQGVRAEPEDGEALTGSSLESSWASGVAGPTGRRQEDPGFVDDGARRSIL